MAMNPAQTTYLPPSKSILKHGSDWEAEAQTIRANSAYVKTNPSTGEKYVPAGTIFPANDATAKGLVKHDYYLVNNSDVHVALLFKAVVRGDRLPEALTPEAKSALPQIRVSMPTTKLAD